MAEDAAPVVETEEHVDLDEDNYIEEMDDDVDDPTEEDRMEGSRDENVKEEQEPLKTDEHGKAPLSEDDGAHNAVESVEDEEKPTASIDVEDGEKRAELLALPPHGSEIFIGGIPREVTEEDLRGLCEPIGEIAEVRLMTDKDTGESKGYTFITFKTKELAQQAIEEFHNKDFKGRTLRCSLSQAKHRLFIGNIPKSWSEEDLRRVIEENGPGVENIELLKDPQNSSRNRGFAFIEYYNNACADYARQNMSSPKFRLDGNTPTISWADPKSAPDPSAAAQAKLFSKETLRKLILDLLNGKDFENERDSTPIFVSFRYEVKALYVKNLPENTTTEQLKELFQQHGEVTKVVLPPGKAGQSKRDFGFIHFAERSSALKAVKETEKYEIDGHVLDVSLAKPLNEKKFDTGYSYKPATLPSYPAYPYGDPYGALGAGYGGAVGYQQPVIYGRGPMPAGMRMVPMVLPDGRLGYVLQQPGAEAPSHPPPPRRYDRSSGSGGPQGRGGRDGSGGDGSRNRRYQPY